VLPSTAEHALDRFGIHLDGALEGGAILEAHAWRGDVAANLGALAHDDLLGPEQITLDGALDEDGVGVDVCLDLALGADGQRVALELDRAGDFTFHRNIFLAAQRALDLDRRADDRGRTTARGGASRSTSRTGRGIGGWRRGWWGETVAAGQVRAGVALPRAIEHDCLLDV